MVIRLHSLSRWKLLEAGKYIEINGERDRKVRVEFNTEAPTRLDLVWTEAEETEITFLAVILGMEVVEFHAPAGTAIVATSEGEVWYFTDEGEVVATDKEAVSYTKIMNRRARNPQLEMMMFKMEQNMNARMALMEDEVAARIEAMGVKHDTATGEVIEDDAAEDEPDADADALGDGKQAKESGGSGGDSKQPTDTGAKPAKPAKS